MGTSQTVHFEVNGQILAIGDHKFWGAGRFYDSTPKPYTPTVCHGHVHCPSRMRRRCTCYTVGMPRCTLTHRQCAAAMRYMYNFTSRMRGKNVERDWRDCLAVHCASRCYQTTRWHCASRVLPDDKMAIQQHNNLLEQ